MSQNSKFWAFVKKLTNAGTFSPPIPIAEGGTNAITVAAARNNLGLGSAAVENVGTNANEVIQLDGTAKLPAVDGSQLTNLPGGSGNLLAVNNLSDVNNATTSRNNIGAGIGDGDMLGINNLSDVNNATTSRNNIGAGIGDGDMLGINNLSDVNNAATARSNLGLGSAAINNVGTGANNVVQLDGSAKLPAVDGSALTNLPSEGKLVNYQVVTSSARTSTVFVITYDDSIPQITQGAEFLNIPYTPLFSDSILIIKVQLMATGQVIANATFTGGTSALFVNNTANALTAATFFTNFTTTVPGNNVVQMTANYEHSLVSGSTTLRTYRVRAGVTASNHTLYVNGFIGSRLYGAIPKSHVSVTEIRP